MQQTRVLSFLKGKARPEIHPKQNKHSGRTRVFPGIAHTSCSAAAPFDPTQSPCRSNEDLAAAPTATVLHFSQHHVLVRSPPAMLHTLG